MLHLNVQRKNISKVSWLHGLISPVLAVCMTLIISSILLKSLGYPVLSTLNQFFISPLTTLYEFTEVLMKASILAMIAFGLAIGFRANIWNIGAEGQFVIGAIFGSSIALIFHNKEGFYIIPLMMLVGSLGGFLWAMIPALLKNRFNTNEILSSLMLVYIAELFLSYLVHGPIRDPMGMNFPQTVYFSESAIYPYLIEGTRFSITPIIVLILLALVSLLLNRSYLGFQLRVSGYSNKAAKYAGFSSKKMVWISFAISGSLAGLAGISEVSSNISQLIPEISPGYGFTAIIVAFLGRLMPVGICLASFLLALIYIGSEAAQITLGLPVSMGGIFQGLILFCLLGADFFQNYSIKWRFNK